MKQLTFIFFLIFSIGSSQALAENISDVCKIKAASTYKPVKMMCQDFIGKTLILQREKVETLKETRRVMGTIEGFAFKNKGEPMCIQSELEKNGKKCDTNHVALQTGLQIIVSKDFTENGKTTKIMELHPLQYIDSPLKHMTEEGKLIPTLP